MHIRLVSDGTGDTALSVLKAALIQYIHEDIVTITRHNKIKSKEQLERMFEQIKENKHEKSVVVYTLVTPEIRTAMQELSKTHQVKVVDLLEDLIHFFDQHLVGKEKQAGILRSVNEEYFKRIEAMDFFLKHDDGQLSEDLDNADIILVGVSRTSKTPLSLFLSNKGWKVANIALVSEIDPPESLFKVDQKKIIALTIKPDYLLKIRKTRLEKFGYDSGANYADKDRVYKEVLEMQDLFQKHKWPVIDVTERALEETATEIVRIISTRLKIPVKIF